MGPYAGADYNLTFFPLQSQLINHGQPNARVNFNRQSRTLDLASFAHLSSLFDLTHPSPLPKVFVAFVQYIQTVCGCEGGRV